MANALFRPALRILDRIPIHLKFNIIGSVFLLAAVVPTVLMLRSQNAAIAAAAREQGGVLFFKPLFGLAQDVTLHRLALPAGSSGEAEAGLKARGDLETAIREDFSALERIPPDLQAVLGTRDEVARLHSDWKGLQAQQDPGRQALAHDGFLQDIRSLESKVVDSSLLIADDEVISTYLVDLAAIKLPEAAEQTLRLALLERQGPTKGEAADGGWKAQVDRRSGAIQGVLGDIRDELSPRKAFADPEVRRRLGDLLWTHQEATDAFLKLAAPQAGGQAPAALDFAGKEAAERCFLFQGTALRALEDLLQKRIQTRQREQRLALASSVAAALLAFYLLAALYAGLKSGFGAVGSSLAALAAGDLTRRARVASRDELGTLAGHLNQALDSAEKLVTQIQVSARTILESTRHIAQGSEDLARRTEAQAASLEQSIASVASITDTVTQTSAEARQAGQQTGHVDELIKACRDFVAQAASAIQEISRTSSQVVGVTGIVEEVSFHANLLAVDAVETAAAGDREKGFTTLASQVQGLGKRSAEASRQIRGLLEDTLASIQRGAASAAQAVGAVESISHDLREVTAAIAEITGSAQEQSLALAQISQAMDGLGEVTLRNSAMVSRTKDDAESLALHAQLLTDLTSEFKVKEPATAG